MPVAAPRCGSQWNHSHFFNSFASLAASIHVFSRYLCHALSLSLPYLTQSQPDIFFFFFFFFLLLFFSDHRKRKTMVHNDHINKERDIEFLLDDNDDDAEQQQDIEADKYQSSSEGDSDVEPHSFSSHQWPQSYKYI